MISDIKDILSMLHDLYKSNMDKKYKEFNDCITEIFEKTKNIEENYIDILSQVRHGVIYENWDGDTTIKYLNKVEHELKSERIYVREETKHLNKIYNGELETFVGAIFNIMYCEYVDRFKHGKDIQHRFTGLIQDAKHFQYDMVYKSHFIQDINYMLKEVNNSWMIVCSEYFALRKKYGDKL